MLTITGSSRSRYCDGISRRQFLQIGALGCGGLTLADLCRQRAQGGTAGERKHKAVIMIVLHGGPSHIDTYDLKPNAPAEVRGEFQPIRTTVPGLDICELLPLQAKLADKLAIVRNLQFKQDVGHFLPEPLTGFSFGEQQRLKRPSFGAAVSRVSGQGAGLPRYVSLIRDAVTAEDQARTDLVDWEDPSYAGPGHRPFVPTGPGGLKNLSLAAGITLDQLTDRKALLQSFDNLQRRLDGTDGLDPFTALALEIIASRKARDAFDLSQDPAAVRARYGEANNAPATNPLLALRLVEAGVSVVTLQLQPRPGGGGSNWDMHGNNFKMLRETHLPMLDRAVSALVTDLHARGLDQDVAVLVWGEMGRTPKVNKDAGRDHWLSAAFALFAGGGLRMGQTVGATDARAERPTTLPYHPQNVLATLYHVLGIDPQTTIPDHNGRPMYLLDDPRKIAELV